MPSAALLPTSAPGLRIGLFGGSFNPPHPGHRLVAMQCLTRLRLDQVWILVSPRNPLKNARELAPLTERIAATAALMAHPRVRVTAFEAALGLRYTADTLAFLTRALPDRRFVWIMGADNLAGFNRWERWDEIARTVPIAIYTRPGATAPAASALARRFGRNRLDESDAPLLAASRPPAWVLLHGRQSAQSSTALRAVIKQSLRQINL